jgi:hypothetical protein
MSRKVGRQGGSARRLVAVIKELEINGPPLYLRGSKEGVFGKIWWTIQDLNL